MQIPLFESWNIFYAIATVVVLYGSDQVTNVIMEQGSRIVQSLCDGFSRYIFSLEFDHNQLCATVDPQEIDHTSTDTELPPYQDEALFKGIRIFGKVVLKLVLEMVLWNGIWHGSNLFAETGPSPSTGRLVWSGPRR